MAHEYLKIENSYLPSPKDGKPYLLNKEEYSSIVRENRKAFIELHFKDSLTALAKKIVNAASRMEECRFEMEFDLPSHLNSEFTVKLLSEFLVEEYGYLVARLVPHLQPGNPVDNNVILVLS